MKLQLLTDQALGENQSEKSDGLGFDTYANVLAEAALGTPGPFTIGVFGEWGHGKTSLMRLTESQLKEKSKKIITVWFNAWRYEKEEHPIVPLVGTIVHELEANQTFLIELKEQGKKLIRALRAVAYGFSAKSKVKVPGFAEIEASFVARDMIDREKQLTPDPLLDRSLYFQAFEALSSVELPSDVKIIILIDDLDRCFPEHAVHLLESIKLVLCQKGFVFVLGVARKVIEGFLEHRYAEEYGISDFQGSSYLDKIVQLPFSIPPHLERMHNFSSVILKQVDKNVRDQLTDILPTVAEALGANPRAVIRFVNNVLIDLAINQTLAESGKMQRISVEYFAVSRGLQQRWPDIYNNLITLDENTAKEIEKWNLKKMQETATSEEVDLSGKAAIAKKLISEPDLRRLLQSKPGRSWLIEAQTRNAAVHFLQTTRREPDAKQNESALDEYDVYVSYSKVDKEKVSELITHLADAGIRAFWDIAIRPGENINEVQERELKKCKIICICISKNTSGSEEMLDELDRVVAMTRISKNKNRIIPIILPGSSIAFVPVQLRELQPVNFSAGLKAENVNAFALTIKRLLESL